MTEFCESLKCRHRLFSDYFGDDPPDCQNRCDVCKNKEVAAKHLEQFQQLSCKSKLKGFIDYDADQIDHDIYGGGRKGMQETYEAYQNDDSNGSSSSNDARRKKDDKDFIAKQFALRKLQAAKDMEMEPSASISKVKYAQSTSTKVAGLTNSVRESYLTLLADALKSNVEACNGVESPDHALVYKDFEDIGIELEYEAFTNSTVTTIYRRGVIKHLNALKKLTEQKKLYPQLKTHVPKKRSAKGGEFKAIVEEMRGKYGNEFVAGFEKEQKPKVTKERNKTGNFSKERANQTMMDRFFKNVNSERENCAPEPETKEIMVDDDVTMYEPITETVDLEVVQEDKKEEIEVEMVESNGVKEPQSTPKSITKQTVPSLKRKHSDLFGDSSGEESPSAVPPKLIKHQTIENSTPIILFKPPRIAYDRLPKAVPPKPVSAAVTLVESNSNLDSSTSSPTKLSKPVAQHASSSLKPSKPENSDSKHVETVIEKPKNSKSDHQTVKKSVSDIVIKYLMPHYKSKVIVNKDLFKAFARTVSHKFYDKEYDDNIIKNYIDKHIASKGKIEKLDDLS